VVSITNGGDPIDPELLLTLFEPFSRGAGGSSDSNMGLGLYIAQKIADSHGGSIAVRSSVAEGTTFTVRLPRS
jgi:signal transduction histidine kinase